MIPNAARKGRSFKGVIAYIIHDPDQARTAERVLFTETHNLRTDDPEQGAKIMAYTALHAAELKAGAGLKASGRKTDCPVYHLSLSWVPGETPTRAEMCAAGRAALDRLGYGEHEAIFAAHGDKPHFAHLHIVINRVHPVTGKTHNPKDDHKMLQAWAHEFDKARGLEQHSPVRAAKHEKRKARLQADYQLASRGGEGRGGANDNSRPRLQWQAEQGATHPRSQRYQDIKVDFAQRVKSLIADSRALTLRHREQWQVIKARHTQARAELWQDHRAAYRDRTAAFARAAAPTLTWPQFQARRKTMTAVHKVETRALAAEIKLRQTPQISAFLGEQKQQRDEFRTAQRAFSKRTASNFSATVQTPLARIGPEHRGHLSALFSEATTQSQRQKTFLDWQKQQKAAFVERLDAQTQPLFARLKAEQADKGAALYQQFKASRAATKTARQDRQTRAALTGEHVQERTVLKAQQRTERGEVQRQWRTLNEDRAKAWDGYRQHRAGQEPTAERAQSALSTQFQRSADVGRAAPSRGDSGRAAPTPGGGRENKR